MVFLVVLLVINQYPKETNPVKIVFSTAIKIYQKVISPAQGDICNFSPSCSNFAAESVKRYGVFWGTLMSADRLMRCHPGAFNYYDTYYSGIKDYKIYDPVENNFIFNPIKKPFEPLK